MTDPAKKRILVVDDEQGYLDLYIFLLEPLGFEVTCAANGLEALQRIEQRPYDLVFMDVHMPVMTGPEAFQRIRRTRPDQKVAIFSSSSDPAFVKERETVRDGAVVCLYKPVTIDEIQRVLAENIGL